MKANLVPSGVEGLDQVLGGGFQRRRCIALSGAPGSGKTTLSIQFLYKGFVEYGEPGIYVTLTENPEEVRENFASFGWNLKDVERKNGLKIIDARPVLATKDGLIARNEDLFQGEEIPFSHLAKLVLSEIRKNKAKRVVIDSITVLVMQYEDRFYIRQGLLGLIQVLSSQECTSLLLMENIGEQNTIPMEWALVHGVASIRHEPKGDDIARSIQILKMRGAKHGERVYSLEIGDSGVVIHPEVTVSI